MQSADDIFWSIIGLILLVFMGTLIYVPFKVYADSQYYAEIRKEIDAGIGLKSLSGTITRVAHEQRRVGAGLYITKLVDTYLIQASVGDKVYTDTVDVYDLDYELVGSEAEVIVKPTDRGEMFVRLILKKEKD